MVVTAAIWMARSVYRRRFWRASALASVPIARSTPIDSITPTPIMPMATRPSTEPAPASRRLTVSPDSRKAMVNTAMVTTRRATPTSHRPPSRMIIPMTGKTSRALRHQRLPLVGFLAFLA